MTEQDIRDMRELDEAAERAGGYVADPRTVKRDEKFEKDFSTMRQYCLKTRKKFSELGEEDYKKMGIRPF